MPYHGRFSREHKRWVAIVVEDSHPLANEPNYQDLVERAERLRQLHQTEMHEEGRRVERETA